MSKLNYRILIIDDSAEDRELYRLYLSDDKECNYEFEECEMGAEGLERALNEKFDCLLVDYGLPDESGLSVLKKLQTLRPNDHAPVVIVTGQGTEGIAVEALRLGAQDYLVKSQITPHSIFRATRNAIEKHSSAILLRAETDRRLRLQEQLSILVEGARDHALILLDTEGHISTWNSGAASLTGYSEEEVLGKKLDLLYRKEDQLQGLANREIMLASRSGKVDLERWLVKKSGEQFWATGSLSLLQEAGGIIRGFAKIVRDDTVKKRFGEEQASREKWLEVVLDSVPTPIVLFDMRIGRLIFSNRTANHLVGGAFPHSESREDFLGNYSLRDKDGVLFTSTTHPWLRALDGEKLELCEVTWPVGRDSVSLLTTSEVLPPLFGRESIVILSLFNISALKQLQSELKGAKFAAEVAATAKSQFLANMSHEIRTPLGVVIGFSELSARSDVKPEQKARFVDVIKRNGKILTQLIDGILDLSKIEAGRLNLTYEDFDLSILVADIVETYSAQAEAKHIKLDIVRDERLPKSILTDVSRLRQIVYNLMDNAIKFTEAGTITITIALSGEPGTAGTVVDFTVKDTGIGISPEYVDSLFSPFTQADSSITRKYGGTGLGLMLCAKLSDALGGKLELQSSALGEGSQFRLTLPVNLSRQLSSENPTLTSESSIAGKKILVVEDSDDARELLTSILMERGVLVGCATDGREALELVANETYDLIIMDVQMSGMDGYTATRHLRESGYHGPIIGLSANFFHEDRSAGLASGMDDYLTKPFQTDALIGRLAWHLESDARHVDQKNVLSRSSETIN